MPTTKPVPVKDLKLDLNNFRTVPQSDETEALHAMISIAPERFWALTESLLDGGYLPTENIIVLDGGKEMIVKEGNRRIGALKLVFGHIKSQGLSIPEDVEAKIGKVSSDWKKKNEEVPCAIYNSTEAGVVDRIVTLAHGKGERAGRDNWTSVARARHNREKNDASEPALDLLEKYLEKGKNLTIEQKERWGGEYPLTVLEDAIKRIAPRLGFATAKELADNFPAKIKRRKEIENILRDIGLETLDFEAIRNKNEDFAQKYGFPLPAQSGGTAASQAGSAAGTTGSSAGGANASGSKKPKALAANDPKSVIRTLKKFFPKGNNREKLVTLLDEARKIKLHKHPHSFCFLLRSMFEISAKAYCLDYTASGGPSATKSGGELVRRIEAIAAKGKSITLKKLDAKKFILEHLPTLPKKSLVYCDPPYYHKSKRLYLNDYEPEDHVQMAKIIQRKIKQHWIVSYDDAPEILKCYPERRSFFYSLPYHATKAYRGTEVFFVSDDLKLPSKSIIPSISNALQALR